MVVPVVTVALTVTNGACGLVWADYRIVEVPGAATAAHEPGAWFYFPALYGSVSVGVGLLVLSPAMPSTANRRSPSCWARRSRRPGRDRHRRRSGHRGGRTVGRHGRRGDRPPARAGLGLWLATWSADALGGDLSLDDRDPRGRS